VNFSKEGGDWQQPPSLLTPCCQEGAARKEFISGAKPNLPRPEETTMNLSNQHRLFPLFVTDKLSETRDFYIQKMGAKVIVDMEDYKQFRFGDDENSPEICFMKPMKFPDGREAKPFPGSGVIVSIPTSNADDKHQQVKEAGAKQTGNPENRPWGWRSFYVEDPNGITLDFFHVLPNANKPTS
jgi:predicted enzyme related to lactoylglutathione lyase